MTTIIRIRRRHNPFIMLDPEALTDARLSFSARGLWAFCMAAEPHGMIYKQTLIDASPGGSAIVERSMRELAKYGYATREPVKGKKGKVNGSQWVLFESPELSK